MSDTMSIAADFIATAQQRAANNAQTRIKDARAQFGQMYDDYERELDHIMQAINRLPPTLRSSFNVYAPAANESRKFGFTIDCEKQARQGHITYTFDMWMDSKKITVDTEWRRGEKYGHTSRTVYDDFAAVRQRLAIWFGDIAPDRSEELREILMPGENVTLKRSLQASTPIRLKAPEATP